MVFGPSSAPERRLAGLRSSRLIIKSSNAESEVTSDLDKGGRPTRVS